VHKLKCY